MTEEKVESIIALQNTLRTLYSDLTDHVREVAKRVSEAAYINDECIIDGNRYPHSKDLQKANTDWNIKCDCVSFSWEVYGGLRGGEFTFPVEFLYDEAAIQKFEAVQKKKKEDREVKRRQQLLEDLKKTQAAIKKQLATNE